MIKKNSLAYFILLGLEKSIQSGVLLIDFAYNPHLYAWSGYPRNIQYGSFYKAVKDLREKGFLETSKTDQGKIIMKLTSKGRDEMILKKILEEKKWDGKYRVVIFDIPEKNRKLRNILRYKLKEWKFEPWQKSVWAGKKDVTKHLRGFIKEIGISEWVRVIEGLDV